MTTKSEVESLIYLLEDPDPQVRHSVRSRLQELGENVVPLLDQYRMGSDDAGEKSLIRDIIHKITFGSLCEDFSDFLEEGTGRDRLEKAIFLLARFGNPTLRTEVYRRKLDRFASDISGEIASRSSETGKMHALLRYVFRELRFRGDMSRFHDTDNIYLDRVIERRRGLPLSLGLVVIFLARRLGLPFCGVNMPIHFMLLYKAGEQEILIDPFDGGAIVTCDQCHYFLKKNGIPPRPEHFSASGDKEILVRSVRNLMYRFEMLQRGDKISDLQLLLHDIERKG